MHDCCGVLHRAVARLGVPLTLFTRGTGTAVLRAKAFATYSSILDREDAETLQDDVPLDTGTGFKSSLLIVCHFTSHVCLEGEAIICRPRGHASNSSNRSCSQIPLKMTSGVSGPRSLTCYVTLSELVPLPLGWVLRMDHDYVKSLLR